MICRSAGDQEHDIVGDMEGE